MKKQIYEITFWVRENKGEEVEEKIISLLNEFNFELIKKMPLKTKELAYPVNKEKFSQLGTMYFDGEPTKIENFKIKTKQINEILRFIILRRKSLRFEEAIKPEAEIEASEAVYES